EGARFLPVAATPADTARLLRLLRDPHPAVHIAAVATLERVSRAPLAPASLDRLPQLAPTVGAYYAGMLRRSRTTVVRLLLTRLRRRDDAALARLAEFAARLQEPALREALTALAGHGDAEVRTQVARALGAFPHAESLTALTRLAGDAHWPVRAQAARSLGMLANAATLLLVLSIPEIWEQTRLAEDEDFQRLMQSDALPPITILVPAYNEQKTIEASVTAILALHYRNYEVVVVNDGSKDGTLEALRHAFDLYEVPRTYPETIPTKPLRALYRSRARTKLVVIDKENGGKADSLNAAINASRFPLVLAVDA